MHNVSGLTPLRLVNFEEYWKVSCLTIILFSLVLFIVKVLFVCMLFPLKERDVFKRAKQSQPVGDNWLF